MGSMLGHFFFGLRRAAAVLLLTAASLPLLVHDSIADEAAVLKLEQEVTMLAVKGQWEAVVEKAAGLIETSPDSADLFTPVLAHGLARIGDKDAAIKLLEGRDDLQSRLLLGSLTGTETTVKGLKEPVVEATPVFVKVKTNGGGLGLGIFPKQAEKIALKKGLFSLIPEPTKDQLKLFNDTVMAKPSDYFVTGEVLAEEGKSALCIAFVNVGMMKDALALYLGSDKERVAVGVLTRSGSDTNRQKVEEILRGRGFKVKDLGRGDFYAMGDRAKVVGIIVELSEDTAVSAGVLGSKFKNISASVKITFYNTTNGKDLGRVSESFTMVHLDELAGKEEALAKAYDRVSGELLSSLASVENKVKWLEGGAPPVEVAAETGQLFSSNYKFYAENAFGKILVTNNTERAFGGVKVSFSIKDFVDFPTQIDVGEVKAGETVTKDLTAIFNSAIVNLTDDTYLQSELKTVYFDLGKEQVVTTTHPIFVYEKHALVWDDKGKVASFITPKDPVVVGFASKALDGRAKKALPKNLIKARDVFSAMGVLGIEYMEDPNNPYSVVSGLTTVVDYVQFPRETLERKRGDCDDLTSLYVSSLESLGIKTKLLDAPGHIFMFLDTGVPVSLEATFGFPEDMYVVEDRKLWIPVEVTRVGASFTVAWQKGAERYNKYRDDIRIIQLDEARRMYLAPNLPAREFTGVVSREAMEAKYGGELQKLEDDRFTGVASSMGELGAVGLSELMALYARAGRLDDAVKTGETLLQVKRDGVALNNMGNVYYIKGNAGKAVEYYSSAAEMEPGDSGIFVNLTRAHLKAGSNEAAAVAFGKAIAIDPGVEERNIAIQMELRK